MTAIRSGYLYSGSATGTPRLAAPKAKRAASRRWLYYNSLMAARLMPVLWKSSGVTLRALWRVARQLFHEAAGTLFAAFAIYGVVAAWRQWKYRPVPWLMGFALIYAVMMAAFAFAAFRSARRIR
jgi:hypothetical protein